MIIAPFHADGLAAHVGAAATGALAQTLPAASGPRTASALSAPYWPSTGRTTVLIKAERHCRPQGARSFTGPIGRTTDYVYRSPDWAVSTPATETKAACLSPAWSSSPPPDC
ncbi:hypothetical protein ACFQ3Z_07640 [Streptomyces nogalater]